MAGDGSITVFCSCGKKLKAPAGSIGRKAKCPACGKTLVLTAPGAMAKVAAAPRPKPVVVPSDDNLDVLYDLAAQAESAPPPVDGVRCSQCASEMQEGAVLCTNCGYNTRTGKSLATTTVTKPAASSKSSALAAFGSKPAGKPVDLMAPTGSFVMGLALSAAFAVAASILWFLVAWATGFSVGYIAILIGGAAGAGMKIGQKGFSTVGGVTAATMTLAAIILAKFAVIEAIIIHAGSHKSIFDLPSAALGAYFFSPIGLVIIAVGMGAAFRTANGSVSG